MARCDEGYRCEVCGQDVERMTDSDLYLRYVMGEVPLERLHLQRERHIRCNPELAQYIADSRFEPVVVEGPFAKGNFEPGYVEGQEILVTKAWRRLQELPTMGLTLAEYPLE